MSRVLIKMEHKGKLYTFKELSKLTGINEGILRQRYYTGYRGEALTTKGKLKAGRKCHKKGDDGKNA